MPSIVKIEFSQNFQLFDNKFLTVKGPRKTGKSRPSFVQPPSQARAL